MADEKIYLYPVWIRIWHWFNALSFITLTISGLSMQYSNIDFTILPFELSVTLHNFSGIAVIILTTFFIVVNRFTRNGDYYNIKLKSLATRLTNQSKYYLFGIFKGESCPYPVSLERKFNPLQRLAYVLVMYIFYPVLIISGIGLFYPELIPMNFLGLNGILLTAILHATLGFICSLFLIVHVYLCTMGKKPGSLYKGMITGYHQ